MNGLAPIPGDAGQLRVTAEALVAEAHRISALRRVLSALDAGDGWDSPAGQAFIERVRAAPAVLQRVAHRYGAGGAALREYAAALAHVQAETTHAIRTHQESSHSRDQLGELMVLAEQRGDAGEAARCRARMVAAGEAAFGAERRYRAAWELFADADRRCGRTLRALALDGLVDSGTYDALTGLGDGAGRLAFELDPLAALPTPQSKPLQVLASAASGAQVASEVVLRVGYGDGDLDVTAIAGSVIVAVLGRGSSWLRSSATARGVNGYAARLRAGAHAEVRGAFRKQPNPRPPQLPRLAGRSGRARVEAVRQHASARLRFEAERRFLTDWRTATANGPQGRRLLLASVATGELAQDTQRALEDRERLLSGQRQPPAP